MRISHLFKAKPITEAGIRTADVDRAARAAITKIMPQIVAGITKEAETEIGPYAPVADKYGSHGEYNSDYYDRLYQWISRNERRVFLAISHNVSKALTKVTDEIAKRRFGDKDRQGYMVQLVARELSDDSLKHYGGYHSSHQNLIRVFIDGNRMLEAMDGVLHDELFGEDSEGYKKKFLDTVVPTFVHEYAHYEQGLRGRSQNNDLGYITLGQKRHKVNGIRRGKRGGVHRTPNESPEANLRYHGASHEIDAFASGAAAQIVQDLQSSFHDDEATQNQRIEHVRRSLNYGFSDGDYRRFERKYYASLAGEIPGLRHDEMTKVWHRFLRLLYAKLGDYLHPVVGKAPAYERKKLDPTWVRFAQTNTMPQTVRLLARETARDLVDLDDDWTTAERINAEVDRGYAGGYEVGPQHHAEDFLRHYYFGQDWFDKEAQFDKLIAVYRQLVKKDVSVMVKPRIASSAPLNRDSPIEEQFQ